MVYRAGDRAEEMYFVVRGVVHLERPAPHPAIAAARGAGETPPPPASLRGSSGCGDSKAAPDGPAAGEAEVAVAGPGDAFGEAGLFADIGGAFQGETARVDSEEADLYVLPAGRVAELEGRYPAEMRRLRELCEMRAAEALVRARAAGTVARPAEGSLAGCRCSSCGPPAVVPISGFGCLRFDRPTHPPTHPPARPVGWAVRRGPNTRSVSAVEHRSLMGCLRTRM